MGVVGWGPEIAAQHEHCILGNSDFFPSLSSPRVLFGLERVEL